MVWQALQVISASCPQTMASRPSPEAVTASPRRREPRVEAGFGRLFTSTSGWTLDDKWRRCMAFYVV
jgi:hypothetical protein